MRCARMLVGCLVLTAAIAGFPAGAAASPGARMLDRVNDVRNARGLPSLRRSPSLTRSSRSYAGSLMRSDRFGHASRIRASSRFRLLGEVLAIHRGWRARVSGTVRSWMRSPGHNRELMNPRMRYLGAGKARGRFGRGLMTIWVVQVGRK